MFVISTDWVNRTNRGGRMKATNNSRIMKTFRRLWLFIVLLTGWLLAPVDAQTATVISDSQAAQHVAQKVSVERRCCCRLYHWLGKHFY
jgi:hypothetical protein